jgi:two-component sensor histidine kinase
METRSRLKYAPWLLVPIAWVFAALVSSARGGMLIENGKATPMAWSTIFSGALYEFFWWMILAPVTVVAARRLATIRISQWLRVTGYIVLGIAVVLAFFVLRSLVTLPGDDFRLKADMGGLHSTLPTSIALYGITLAGTLSALAFGRARDREREAAELSLKASRLQTQLVEAQLGVLRAQLHPHFLFNALHAVSTLVDWRPKEARRMLVRLSELLRLALELSEERQVTLAREIDWLERYLELQQIRFGERLTVDLRIAPETVSALVPPLILQPLVENALEHGVERGVDGGRVEILAERDGKWLRMRVRNDGPPLSLSPQPKRPGVGLRNTRERLLTLFGDEQQLVLRSLSDTGVEAMIELPWSEDAPVTAAKKTG